jgi:DNA-binding NarL/FixJ family response regulator
VDETGFVKRGTKLAGVKRRDMGTGVPFGGETSLKVLLVDDHPLFLDGLQHLLASRGVEVVGTARDGLEALDKTRALHPDVILMDIQMPRLDGLAALRLIKAELPNVKIVMLTMSDLDADLFEAIKNGASGYLLKTHDTDEFFALFQQLARGEAALAPRLAARLMREYGRLASAGGTAFDDYLEELTARQTEVLALVTQGLTYKEVGERLCLTERTVKYHMSEIIQRLHVESRAQVVQHARKTGLV